MEIGFLQEKGSGKSDIYAIINYSPRRVKILWWWGFKKYLRLAKSHLTPFFLSLWEGNKLFWTQTTFEMVKSRDNAFKCKNIIKWYVDISIISIWSIEIHKKPKSPPFLFRHASVGWGERMRDNSRKKINWIKLQQESSWGAELFRGKNMQKSDFFNISTPEWSEKKKLRNFFPWYLHILILFKRRRLIKKMELPNIIL